MAIAYTLTKIKGKLNLSVEQDTNVLINYVCDSSKNILDTIIYSDNSIILDTKKDGVYEVTLKVEGETDIETSFTYIENLRNSILKDICEILSNTYTKKDCSTSNREELDLVEFKNIYAKLLTFQSLYFPIIGENLSNFFSVYLSQVLAANKCSFYTNINTILSEECLYGNSNLNTELFKKFIAYYYVGLYNIEKNIAGEDEDELSFIESKYCLFELSSAFNDLCITVTALNNIFGSVISSNTPPTVDDFVLEVPPNLPNNEFVYNFTGDEFTENFTDIQGNLPLNVKFFTLPVRGNLTFQGSAVTINTPYPFEDVTDFKYEVTIDVNEEIFDILVFQISDDNINEAYSEMATMTMNTAAYINLPISQLGDGVITLDNREDYVYTINDFTTNLSPPYVDPEGDSLDAIRVNELPAGGTLKLNGVAVTTTQIISAANINSGLFTFTAPNQNPYASNSFDFSARDAGSLEWVD